MYDKATRRYFTLIFAIYLTMALGYISHNPESTQRPSSQATPAGYSVAPETAPKGRPIVTNKNIRIVAKRWLLQRIHLQEWKCFDELIYRESRWTIDAQNPNSTAFGLGQVLGSRRYTEGKPMKQFKLAVRVALHKHQTFCNALKHHDLHGWY